MSELKMTEKEFYTLESIQLKLKNSRLEAENIEKERRIKALSRRIHELEATLCTHQYNQMVAKSLKLEKELEEKREEIAKRVGVDSLDPYFVDDETYQLKHENEIPELANNKES